MGNNKSKKEKNDVENYLTDTFKNTDIEFSVKEITSFKLRIKDAENYFHSKFDFFFYFNDYIFRERLSILYDNFNSRIEKFSKIKSKPSFTVLIDFEDEQESISRGMKVDFDPLYTIIFEKLEISVLFFLDLTNVNKIYINEFFMQLIESVDLYKFNRKFDCLYFLLPNTDYIIKNDCGLFYVSNKKIHNKKLFFNEEVNELKNEYTEMLNQMEMKMLVNARYQKNEANNFFEYFIEKVRPTMTRMMFNFNLSSEPESLILNNEDQFRLLEFLIHTCSVNTLILENSNFLGVSKKIREIFIKKIVSLLDKSKLEESVLILQMKIINEKFITNKDDTILRELRTTIFKLLNDFNTYNTIHNRRKLIIEFYQFTPDSTENLNNSTELTQKTVEFSLCYDKIFFYWFLHQKNTENIDIILFLGILLKQKNFNKLRNKKVIKQIREFLFNNFSSRHTTKVIKQLSAVDITNLNSELLINSKNI